MKKDSLKTFVTWLCAAAVLFGVYVALVRIFPEKPKAPEINPDTKIVQKLKRAEKKLTSFSQPLLNEKRYQKIVTSVEMALDDYKKKVSPDEMEGWFYVMLENLEELRADEESAEGDVSSALDEVQDALLLLE